MANIPETLVSQKAVGQYAFYDLEVSPATFDIVKFLILAEKRRLERGCSDLRVVIVPCTSGFRKGDLEGYQQYGEYSQEYMKWRLKNILVPCCWLLSSVKGVLVCADRLEAERIMAHQGGYLYPEGYSLANPVGRFLDGYLQAENGSLPSLQASGQALNYVRKWLNERTDGRKVVTINLRQTVYEPQRNSNLSQWQKVYHWLEENGWTPLLIPDMEQAYERSNGFRSYPEVVWSVELRLALYELSYLNLFVNTGHAALALYDKEVKCLVFKMTSPGCGETTNRFFELNGLKPGSQWRHASPFQRIVWADDQFQTIKSQIGDFTKDLRKEALV